MTEPLLIVGASARAAAQSARRAGLAPSAIDHFGDTDLVAACDQCARLDGYPRGLIEAADKFPPMPWMYTGALENQPEQIASLAAARPLLGIGGDSLRRVRDPGELFTSLARAGFDCLPWRTSTAGLPRDGSWICKPYRSAGGARIARWQDNDSSHTRENRYWQQFAAGQPCGACYVGNGDDAVLLGVTEQFVGLDWAGARDFQYCGSCGPLAISPPLTARFQSLGRHLTREFELVGLFGVDLILTEHGFWPLEVNPRYTASVEVLERATGIAALTVHLDACRRGALPPGPLPHCFAGKAILYARRDLRMPDLPSEAIHGGDQSWPTIADLPRPGMAISAGSPVLTLLAAAANRASAMQLLREFAKLISL